MIKIQCDKCLGIIEIEESQKGDIKCSICWRYIMQKFFYKCKCGSRGVIKADNKPEEGSIECFVCGQPIMNEDILEPEPVSAE